MFAERKSVERKPPPPDATCLLFSFIFLKQLQKGMVCFITIHSISNTCTKPLISS